MAAYVVKRKLPATPIERIFTKNKEDPYPKERIFIQRKDTLIVIGPENSL
jgi:hypothetical protein